jgi:hypothetical protein
LSFEFGVNWKAVESTCVRRSLLEVLRGHRRSFCASQILPLSQTDVTAQQAPEQAKIHPQIHGNRNLLTLRHVAITKFLVFTLLDVDLSSNSRKFPTKDCRSDLITVNSTFTDILLLSSAYCSTSKHLLKLPNGLPPSTSPPTLTRGHSKSLSFSFPSPVISLQTRKTSAASKP